MRYEAGCEMPIGRELIQPRAEGEIAFVLKRDLQGPRRDARRRARRDRVRDALLRDRRFAHSRLEDPDPGHDRRQRVVGALRPGRDASPRRRSISSAAASSSRRTARSQRGRRARPRSARRSSAWRGSPTRWARYGIPLRAGEVILSGSLVPLEPVTAGDAMKLAIAGIGSAEVRFV